MGNDLMNTSKYHGEIWTSFHRSVRWCHQRDTCKMAWRALSVGGGCTTDGIVMRLNGLPDVPHGSDPDYGPYQYWYRGSWAMSNLAMGSAFFCIQGVVISFHRKITAGSLQTFHEGKSVTSSDQARESIFRVVWKWGTPCHPWVIQCCSSFPREKSVAIWRYSHARFLPRIN